MGTVPIRLRGIEGAECWKVWSFGVIARRDPLERDEYGAKPLIAFVFNGVSSSPLCCLQHVRT
jgi:hypothetical protein